MKIYLVGGAVRDQLLGLAINEKDWVVVDSTPEEMLGQGFKPVGKDFPVFLHPETHEEYALARTERKTAKGYKGFDFYAAPDVTLEDDLKRRDLTINAIAQDEDGKLIDPFNGKADLKAKIFRHVSKAFAEDPVRILRLARFSARFTDFKTDPKTLDLMKKMVADGEVNALVSERVWQEFERALTYEQPQRFFETLNACGATKILFKALLGHDGRLAALKKAAQLTSEGDARFAALLHNIDSEHVKTLCARLRAPKEYRDLALLVSRQQKAYHRATQLPAEGLLKLLESLDAFRRPERLNKFLIACQANTDADEKPIRALLKHALAAANAVSTEELKKDGLEGEAFGKALRERRLKAISQAPSL